MSKEIIIFTAINEVELAEDLIIGLLEDDLIISGTIFPDVKLIYKWEGSINMDEEVKVMIKARAENQAKIEAYIAEHHHYLYPEVVKVDAEFGSSMYHKLIKQKLDAKKE